MRIHVTNKEKRILRCSLFSGPCSNRSASLLKLNKIAKAAADAEACIARRPDWDKAHVRKGAVLEAQEMLPEVFSHNGFHN